MSKEQDNAAFDAFPEGAPRGFPPPGPPEPPSAFKPPPPLEVNHEKKEDPEADDLPQRATWGNQIEFLMSCIATSVGLGNVWRFPFVAYNNGGGAFLIPYIIVLFIIGKPMYYLECVMGQFSTRNSVKIWSLSPAMKGTGYAQAMATTMIMTYYVSIIALCLYYLVFSFQSTLPWAVCDESWTDVLCVPSGQAGEGVHVENGTSSAELFFLRTVIQQKDTLAGGLGLPIWYLVLFLLLSWLIIFVIVARGVKSSGKAAYFLAIFPYIVMVILLISTSTLEGAGTGILFFLTPQWDKLIELNVWYAAVTQVFFSLSVCTGCMIMFSSYNGFRQNVYRDAMIVTTLDTFTSLLSGITIFGILGNLAFVLGREVQDVVGDGGTGLAFISYPDAIAKTPLPQLFSVLFFLMMAVLGVGSAVAMLSAVNTVLLDTFPRVPTIVISACSCTIGFSIGLIYVTPGGQWVLELVDHFGGTFLILFTGITELIGIIWIYGLENVCLDIEFMLGLKTGIYWRWCWGILTPAMMITVFIYALIDNTFGGDAFTSAAIAIGYAILFIGVAMVPLFMGLTMFKNRSGNLTKTVKVSFTKKSSWGPKDKSTRQEWALFKADAKEERQKRTTSKLKHIGLSLLGSYRRGV
ncbi:sodium-dependent nutrient amino acid transporter 1-like isoform X2 [Leguminivora glycinivorella]|uniref:sodium-dependent nutrient amino acid transporter 1-like isoform X2 n=1 Tax=Leguminivora glycinivorella TaxID=1035111 RepID=UPI002010C699|nr:sodium-dependent nutrient amino acid transporter 1-like isoform X2 [Leguminivora glycinivorella]